jgi:hypothetical protein
MAYTIMFLRGTEQIGSTHWAGDLARAEAAAHADFRINRGILGATSIAIVDDASQKVVYVYPNKGTAAGASDGSIPVEDLDAENDE